MPPSPPGEGIEGEAKKVLFLLLFNKTLSVR